MIQPITKQELMKKIRETDFQMQEAKLFLNTHPKCPKALKYFNDVQKMSAYFKNEYEKRYGPITASYEEGKTDWQWISTPWPWQNENQMQRGKI